MNNILPSAFDQADTWRTLFGHFLALSLMSIGGAITLVPDMHRRLVDGEHLLTDADFTGAIALAQAAPGPNVLFVALMGWYSAGLGGALASMLGIMLPSTTLALVVSRWVATRRHRLSVRAFQAGMKLWHEHFNLHLTVHAGRSTLPRVPPRPPEAP